MFNFLTIQNDAVYYIGFVAVEGMLIADAWPLVVPVTEAHRRTSVSRSSLVRNRRLDYVMTSPMEDAAEFRRKLDAGEISTLQMARDLVDKIWQNSPCYERQKAVWSGKAGPYQ